MTWAEPSRATMFLLSDATDQAASQIQKVTFPDSASRQTFVFTIKKGSASSSRIQYYRNAGGSTPIGIDLIWSGTSLTPTQTHGTLRSISADGDIYTVTSTGTVTVADAHVLNIWIAGGGTAQQTGTVLLSGVSVANGSISPDLATWTTAFGATVSVTTVTDVLSTTWSASTATDLRYWPELSILTDAFGGVDFELLVDSARPRFDIQSHPAATIASGFTEGTP